jgi:hypothetical protein
VLSCFSMSAAHKAAPTVFVKAKISEAKGTISRTNDAIPKLQWSMISKYGYSSIGETHEV